MTATARLLATFIGRGGHDSDRRLSGMTTRPIAIARRRWASRRTRPRGWSGPASADVIAAEDTRRIRTLARRST